MLKNSKKSIRLFELFYTVLYALHQKIAYLFKYIVYRVAINPGQWPYNLDLLYVSETAFRHVERKHMGFKPARVSHNLKNKQHIKLGIIGRISDNFVLSEDIIAACPDKVTLYVYDFYDAYKGYHSIRLKEIAHVFHSIHAESFNDTKLKRIFCDSFDYKEVLTQIDEDELDALLLINFHHYGYAAHKMVDLLEIGHCVNINFGSSFFINDKVLVQGKIQHPLLYEVIDNRLFSHRSNSFIPDFRFIEELMIYDRRGLPYLDEDPNNQREPLMFYHGRLKKIYSDDFLEVVTTLLRNDSGRKFYFIGKDEGGILSKIKQYFQERDLEKQIEYGGEYSLDKKNDKGELIDTGWEKTKELLRKCTVYLNTFPLHTGCSKIEAYLSYSCVITLQDDNSLKSKNQQHDILKLLDPSISTVDTKKKYIKLVEEVFRNAELRKKIAQEQYKIARQLTDKNIFWEKTLESISTFQEGKYAIS